jgi:hypothetical protein
LKNYKWAGGSQMPLLVTSPPTFLGGSFNSIRVLVSGYRWESDVEVNRFETKLLNRAVGDEYP